VTIGEALAEARNKAGLSIDEVSERSRVRETVIRGIERDDYEACGGDLYIRGYVRVIAGVVGIDAQPLIREYDLTHSGKLPVISEEPPTTIDPVPPDLRSAEPAEPAPPPPSAQPAPPPPPTAPQPLTSEPPTLIESVIPGMRPIEPTASVTPGMITPEHVASEPLTPQPRPPLVTAASRPVSAPGARPRPRQPTRPSQSAQPPWRARKHSRGRGAGIVALAVVVLAAAGFAASRIVSSLLNSPAKTTAASSAAAGRGASASPGAAKPSIATKGSGTKAATNPAATPTPSVSAAPPSSMPLHVALAEAFGPSGVGDGDNSQGALSPITPGASSPWRTDWYTTPGFGRLKQGTGLLLDMGSSATITSVRITLGSAVGADLQLRVGDTPALADLPVAASASDAGGTVDLSLTHAVSARYVLIWFTLLPPNGVAGQYQASVYQVLVSGQS
jgi:eukaryotic-like serine/threonine-protein kinase